jgi:hypothetical protein
MSIVNRRNAVIGFLTVKAVKIVAREQARKVGRKVTPGRTKSRKKRS